MANNQIHISPEARRELEQLDRAYVSPKARLERVRLELMADLILLYGIRKLDRLRLAARLDRLIRQLGAQDESLDHLQWEIAAQYGACRAAQRESDRNDRR